MFTSLTNVRTKKELGNQVVASPTKGQVKVTPDAAKTLDVRVADYVQVVKDEQGKLYVVKGEKGIGAKLACANKTGTGVLNFSSAMAWESLDGKESANVHYDIDTENAIEFEGRTYYPLAFDKEVEKTVRKKSVKADLKGVDTNPTIATEKLTNETSNEVTDKGADEGVYTSETDAKADTASDVFKGM